MKEKRVRQQDRYFDFLTTGRYVSLLSSIFMLIAIYLIAQRGLSYGIDFVGGTEVQIQFRSTQKSSDLKKEILKYMKAQPVIQKIGEDGKEFLIRLTGLGNLKEKKDQRKLNLELQAMVSSMVKGLSSNYEGLTLGRVDTVGPQIGEKLKKNGLLAVFYAFLIILIYIGLRFDFNYAVSSVMCLIHDTLITLGVLVLLNQEINLQTLAAILTIIGYSLNDTIVTFDRIRENLEVQTNWGLKKVMNLSLNQVLSRSLLTSITTLIAVITMFLLADGVIRDVAFTLIVGVIVGTFSSIYIATPLVYWIFKFQTSVKKT